MKITTVRIVVALFLLVLLSACGSGGGPFPSVTPRPGAMLPTRVPPTDGPTPTMLPSETPIPSATPTPTLTSTPTETPTSTSTPTLTSTPVSTDTPTATPTLIGPQSLDYNSPVVNEISEVQYEYEYYFGGQQDDLLAITLLPGTDNLAVSMRLLDSTGMEIASGVETTEGVRIEALMLPADDTYTIVVGRAQNGDSISAGEFELAVDLLLSAEGAVTAGGGLSYGAASRGLLDDERFEVAYTFEGSSNDVVTVEMWRLSGDLDSFLMLSASTGEVLALNDNAVSDSNSQDARITNFLLPTADTYIITAMRYQGRAGLTNGAFEIALSLISTNPADASEESGIMQYGTGVEDSIGDEHPSRIYRFFGHMGDVVAIVLSQRSGDLDTVLTLQDSFGFTLAENDDASGADVPTDSRIERFTLPESGVYTIIASRFERDRGTTSGDFLLTLDLVTPEAPTPTPVGVPELSYGETVLGVIDDTTPRAMFTFSGMQDDVITISLVRANAEDSLDTLLFLLDDAGILLAMNDDAPYPDDPGSSNSRIGNFRLPATGDYTIVVTRFEEEAGRSSGTFSLQLAHAE